MQFCPQCHVATDAGVAEGIRFLACRSCGGIWLEADAYNAAKGSPKFMTALAAVVPASSGQGSFSGYIKSCPRCIGATLQPMPDSAGTLSCSSCGGVWLSSEERRIIAGAKNQAEQALNEYSSYVPVDMTSAPIPDVLQPSPLAEESVDAPPETELQAESAEPEAADEAPTSRWSAFWQNAASSLGVAATDEEEPADETVDIAEDEGDPILAANELFAADFDRGDLQRPPARGIIILTCMDSRIPVWEMLGLESGDAHILRNAGGIVTEDVLRSLVLSHHLMGTHTLLIINHTDCGLIGLDEAGFRKRLTRQSGALAISPAHFHSFDDLEENVSVQMLRVRSHPWIPEDVVVRGFVYDVRTGKLTEVEPEEIEFNPDEVDELEV